jgi:hypothetical protein
MNEIKIYENSKIRSLWDNDVKKWYIAIVDVIAVLTKNLKNTNDEKGI